MSNKTYLTHTDVRILAEQAAISVIKSCSLRPDKIRLFPIPRGGVPAVYAMLPFLSSSVEITQNPHNATHFIDDLIDSGSTMEYFCDKYPGKPFIALLDKNDPTKSLTGKWIVFPWESEEDGSSEDIQDNIRRMLQFVGEDPNRGGLKETPARVTKAWEAWCSGYQQSPKDVLKVFEDGAEKCDEMVIVKDIPFYSHCEHHMAPFFGTATIAYIPNGKIVGLSKLSRLLDVFSKRLQVQERLTNQVVDALVENLDALGAGCIIRARHLCMESRGVCKQGHHTITSALRGVMLNGPARAEFMTLAK